MFFELSKPRCIAHEHADKRLLGLAIVASCFLGGCATKPQEVMPLLLAHRGVHQTYNRSELDSHTCTATRIYPAEHDYIENTIRSMRAAFDMGADMVELDIYRTTDNQLVVFHDAGLECRTNGEGRTWTHDLAYLKSLDISYGYTADGGKTFPLRGKGIGMMPTLEEVLDAFPHQAFLINFKGPDTQTAELLAKLLNKRSPAQNKELMAYGGGGPPTALLAQRVPEVRVFTKRSIKSCLARYLVYGWTGLVPDACRHTGIGVPVNFAPYVWGWPYRFVARMKAMDSMVFVTAPMALSERAAGGIDDLNLLGRVPLDYPGWIWTNRIEVIGPAVRRRNARMRD